MSEPHSPSTPEREAEAEKVKERFQTVARDIIVPRSQFAWCERCKAGSDHDTHATDEERAASDRAWDELRAMRLSPDRLPA
jgi:hypothetical protein